MTATEQGGAGDAGDGVVPCGVRSGEEATDVVGSSATAGSPGGDVSEGGLSDADGVGGSCEQLVLVLTHTGRSSAVGAAEELSSAWPRPV